MKKYYIKPEAVVVEINGGNILVNSVTGVQSNVFGNPPMTDEGYEGVIK